MANGLPSLTKEIRYACLKIDGKVKNSIPLMYTNCFFSLQEKSNNLFIILGMKALLNDNIDNYHSLSVKYY